VCCLSAPELSTTSDLTDVSADDEVVEVIEEYLKMGKSDHSRRQVSVPSLSPDTEYQHPYGTKTESEIKYLHRHSSLSRNRTPRGIYDVPTLSNRSNSLGLQHQVVFDAATEIYNKYVCLSVCLSVCLCHTPSAVVCWYCNIRCLIHPIFRLTSLMRHDRILIQYILT